MKNDDKSNGYKIEEAPAQANPAALFGEMLRSCREVSSVTVEQLANSTRISPVFIKALEEGQFEVLPGHVFGRGFIRNICRALDTDPTDYLVAFDLAAGNSGAERKERQLLQVPVRHNVSTVRLRQDGGQTYNNQSVFTTSMGNLRHVLTSPYGVAVVVLLLVVVSAYLLRDTSSGPTVSQAPVVAPPQDVAQNEMEGAVAEEELAEAEIAAGDAQTAEVDPVKEGAAAYDLKADQGRDGQVIEMVVKNDVRVRMAVDGGSWTTSELSPERYQFRFEKNVQLLVFDAAAVDISFNGVPVGPLGEKGRVRRLSFAADQPSPTEGDATNL